MLRIVLFLAVSTAGSVWASLSLAQAALDETGARMIEYPRFAVSATAAAGPAFANRCPLATSDMTYCTHTRGVAGFRISPRVRVGSDWALGLSGGVLWLGDGQDVTTQWWDVQVEGRYYLGTVSASQVWLAASLGAVDAVERVPAYSVDTGVNHSARNIENLAPCGSLALGRDYGLSRHLGIALDVRFILNGFHDVKPAGNYEPPQPAVLLELSVNGLGAYR